MPTSRDCSVGTAICFQPGSYLADDVDSPQHEAAVVHLLAHEYGNHLQYLVGISSYFSNRYQRTKGTARLQEHRRPEISGVRPSGEWAESGVPADQRASLKPSWLIVKPRLV